MECYGLVCLPVPSRSDLLSERNLPQRIRKQSINTYINIYI